MKKIMPLSVLIFFAINASAQLQGIRLNGYSAYVFDNSFDTYYTSNEYMRGKIKGGFQWGAGLEFLPNENYGVELVYYRQDTTAPITYEYGAGLGDRDLDVGINYIMAGGVRYMNLEGGKFQPYGGLLLGAVIFSNKTPQGNEESSYVKFGWGARLGTNIWLTEKVGLKLQAQLLSAVQGFGGGLSFGTGGAGAGVSSYSTLMQFGIGGGLCMKIGQVK
jgi:opacity protein-like surface antigen